MSIKVTTMHEDNPEKYDQIRGRVYRVSKSGELYILCQDWSTAGTALFNLYNLKKAVGYLADGLEPKEMLLYLDREEKNGHLIRFRGTIQLEIS